ncbi:MAG: phytanoyl-CoA dioxygenase family protein [Gammaproteobacteria bacterium]|nr:phytanoyl-CoA dioxygenase family protein [Gammaproteobacteria bacterium]MDE0227038.1 phytanoyl-CoA dioxygenase family protein [Gammaproteobacteria bacterium]
MLGRAQIAQYQEDGYVLVAGLLEPDTLDALRAVTDEIVAGAAGIDAHTDALDLEDSHRADAPRVRRIKKPHLVHPFYRQLAAHPAIMAALTPLIGENIRLRAGGKVNIKAAGYGAPVEWHQDWAFYPHTNQDVLAVGILLDDMDAGNGPILFLPGSHLGPIYDHHSQGAFCGAIDVAATGLDVSGAREIHAPAGTVTIHHARLVHGSAMNTSKRQRRILFYEYAAADAWPLAGVEQLGDLREFNSRIVQGRPTLHPRLEAVPVRMPLPAAPHQGSIYENQRNLETRYFATSSHSPQPG